MQRIMLVTAPVPCGCLVRRSGAGGRYGDWGACDAVADYFILEHVYRVSLILSSGGNLTVLSAIRTQPIYAYSMPDLTAFASA
ncbi:hypothetical protein GCM10011342_29870 [Aquisalinus flavus]|uniref:Uncharacterized protein n=1 Tax=Aquisalinus flavus TaxID=1526572 RepID=A0A8J2V3T3_9PROT|nr:hypothetical protein GCM10011342_29870 [Aquisalinus flavus]